MSVQEAREREARSVDAVREFFEMYYGAQITQSEDAQEELVVFHVGASGKPIAVTAEFLRQFEPVEIREKLAAWNVAHLSRTLERGCRLIVSSEGPEEERE